MFGKCFHKRIEIWKMFMSHILLNTCLCNLLCSKSYVGYLFQSKVSNVPLLTKVQPFELDLRISMIVLHPMNLVTHSGQKHLDCLEFHIQNRSLMETWHFLFSFWNSIPAQIHNSTQIDKAQLKTSF